MLKKLFIALAALVIILVVGVTALLLFVDVDRFKPQIEQAVADRFDRKLDIGGKLSLSVFPRLALTLPATTLSDPGGKGQTAQLAGASVSVNLLPLLKGEIVADRIRIDGLNARIVRLPDGRLSIDDLIGGGETSATASGETGKPAEKPAEKSTEKPTGETGQAEAGRKAGGALPKLDIGGLTLTGARLEFDDQQAGNRLAVERLNLETGRIANAGQTPIDLSMAVSMTQPKAAAEIAARLQADYDLAAGRFGARDLGVTVRGNYDTTTIENLKLALARLNAVPAQGTIEVSGLDLTTSGRLAAGAFEAQARAPNLKIADDMASGEAVRLTAKLAGGDSGTIDAVIEASELSGKAQALSIGKLALDVTSAQAARKVVAQLTTPVQGDTGAGTWQLAGLTGKVVVTDPAIPAGTAQLDLSGSASADTRKEAVQADLAARGEGTALTARLGVNGFEKPKIHFDVKADAIDLDRFLPPPAKAGAKPAAGSGTPAPSGAEAAAGEAPIDLSALRPLTVDGRVSVGHLRARGLEAAQIQVAMKAAGGKVDVAPISATLYQGKLGASASVQAGESPAANRASVNVDLANIAIGPLLKAAANNDMLEGRGNVKLTARTGGATVGAMKAGLNGNGAIALRDGAVKGINLAETIRTARSLLQGGGGQNENKASDQTQKTDFTALDMSFTIKDGVASSHDLDMKSPLIRVNGNGSANLVKSTLDYTVNASVVGTSSGQGGRELSDLRGLTVPVRLTGPLDGPNWQIDWATAGREMLKSRAAAELKERLKVDENLQSLQDKAQEKAKGKIGDALKGLLGR